MPRSGIAGSYGGLKKQRRYFHIYDCDHSSAVEVEASLAVEAGVSNTEIKSHTLSC